MAEERFTVTTDENGDFEILIEVGGGPGVQNVNVRAEGPNGASTGSVQAEDAPSTPSGTVTIGPVSATYTGSDYNFTVLTTTVTLNGEYLFEMFNDSGLTNMFMNFTITINGTDNRSGTTSPCTAGDGCWVRVTHTSYSSITDVAQAA